MKNLILISTLGLMACGGGGSSDPGIVDCEAVSFEQTYLIASPADGAYVVTIDTVADDSAFDPAASAAFVTTLGSDAAGTTLGTSLDSGDDDIDCTFPPPSFSCPQLEFDVAGATEDILVTVRRVGSCADESTGEYSVTATVDGADVALDYQYTTSVSL